MPPMTKFDVITKIVPDGKYIIFNHDFVHGSKTYCAARVRAIVKETVGPVAGPTAAPKH